MLETEKLDELAHLLKEMTRPMISHPKFARLLTMERLLEFFVIGLLLFVLATFHLAAWWRPEVTPEFDDALLVIYYFFKILFLALFLSLLTTFAAYLLYIIRHRKQLTPYISASLENALHRDAKFITQLLTFDKATLAYGLLEYRHRWSSLESRAAVIAGDLRKLGLFPAWVALLISAATLFKGNSNPFLLLLAELLLILAIFHLMALRAFLSRERPQQVMQLLEYAIQHADQCNANPSEATTSAPSV